MTLIDFEPGDYVINPENKNWGIGQVQSIIGNKVTVNFVSEIITCVKDKDNKVIEGNPDEIKTVNDVWKFSKNMWSQDPTWYLVEITNK